MSNSILNSDFANQLENMIKDFVQEKLEFIMKEEIKNFLQVEQEHVQNSRNGYYHRTLDTKYGKIECYIIILTNKNLLNIKSYNFQKSL
ncbi:transposase [Bacillus smithii]